MKPAATTDVFSALREACDIADTWMAAATVGIEAARARAELPDEPPHERIFELRQIAAGTPLEHVDAKGRYPRYLGVRAAGDKVVGVRFAVKHGAGHRHETVDLPLEDVLRIADAYRMCGGYDGFPTGGHACWHADNPDMPVPCESAKPPPTPPDLAQLVRNYFALRDRFDSIPAGRILSPLVGRMFNEAGDKLQKAVALVPERKRERCGVEGCRLAPEHPGLHKFGGNVP